MIKEEFFRIIAIGNQIMNNSENIHLKTKVAMQNYSDDIIRRIDEICKNGKQNTSIINSYKKDYLVFWNESISIESELFFQKLQENKIEINRNERLKYALIKNRFQNVHQGMDARKNWNKIIELGYLNERFTKDEIKKLNEIINKDEKDRFEFLKKCYEKKKIPQTKYLRFGDSVAYFNNCNLFKKYFESEQVVELMSIWKNFN